MNTVLVEPLILDPLVDVAAATAAPVVPSDLSLVDHVEVKLTAVLGETELTLADLFALKAGSVLPLAQGLDDPIMLQFNGKPVATATLVAVGDCFGVQFPDSLMAPNTAPAIPFSQAGNSLPTASLSGLLIACVLLALAFAALWYARRRGWVGLVAKPSRAFNPGGLAVRERIRISATCSAFVLGEGDERIVVVESRHPVQVHAWPTNTGGDKP